jgi:hypothetical protein
MNITGTFEFIYENGALNNNAIVGYGLFLMSELLPFLHKKKENNGFLHILVCLLKGSQCITKKLLNVIEEDEKEIEIVV